MGMDVYGRNPITPEGAEELVNKLLEEQKNLDLPRTEDGHLDWKELHSKSEYKGVLTKYFEIDQKLSEALPGKYFRANIWGWRPIQTLIQIAVEKNDLPIDTSYYGSNDGRGCENQEESTMLADAMEELIKDMVGEVYLNTGMYIESGTGRFLNAKEVAEIIAKHKNKKLAIAAQSAVDSNDEIMKKEDYEGIGFEPAHGTSIAHIKRFINFLRHSGGFEIC